MSRNRLVRWVGFVLFAGLVALAPLPAASADPIERLVRVTAGDFAYHPGTIRVNRGDTLTIELTSTDVAHGIYIDGYDLETVTEPGQTARLQFKADRPGTFRLRCSLSCGSLHPFMTGKLEVGKNSLPLRAAGLSLVVALGGLILYRQKVQA